MTSKKDLPEGVYKLDEGDDSVSHPRYVNSVNLSRYTDGKNYHFCTRPEDVRVSPISEIDKGAKCKPDMVNSPPHYQSENGIECIDAIIAALGKEGAIAYCRGNVIKYSWRIKNPHEDMAKAAWYSNKANELLNLV